VPYVCKKYRGLARSVVGSPCDSGSTTNSAVNRQGFELSTLTFNVRFWPKARL
jgi:hypothetical protein